MNKVALIIGISRQDNSYLAEFLLSQNGIEPCPPLCGHICL
jgi:GDP-D-mannose dehydratase